MPPTAAEKRVKSFVFRLPIGDKLLGFFAAGEKFETAIMTVSAAMKGNTIEREHSSAPQHEAHGAQHLGLFGGAMLGIGRRPGRALDLMPLAVLDERRCDQG